jgi:hypothetical protein
MSKLGQRNSKNNDCMRRNNNNNPLSRDSFWPQSFSIYNLTIIALAKRQFTIDTGKEQIPVEGQVHRNVAIKYLMKRRRSLLMTKDSEKVEKLWQDLPKGIRVIGKQVTKVYRVKWERLGREEFEGSRFAFTLEDQGDRSTTSNNDDSSSTES